MSLAETALLESTESTETPVVGLPVPGIYLVGSTGTLQVPLGAEVEIVAAAHPEEKPDLKINGVTRGPIETLPNGDFEVTYPDGGTMIRIQFRQSGFTEEYLFGVVIPEKILPGAPQDDPPITGVWGAEARPPQAPDPNGEKE